MPLSNRAGFVVMAIVGAAGIAGAVIAGMVALALWIATLGAIEGLWHFFGMLVGGALLGGLGAGLLIAEGMR